MCSSNLFSSGQKFGEMFSIPVEPQTALAPGQSFSLTVPEGKNVIITDVYVENLGGGRSNFQILEQTGANSFEIRYTFRTEDGDRTVINFTTGLRLGDKAPIQGSIRIQNADGSKASILPRVNGVFV
jgi:hypothetical protein